MSRFARSAALAGAALVALMLAIALVPLARLARDEHRLTMPAAPGASEGSAA